jgi:hypothetical protein
MPHIPEQLRITVTVELDAIAPVNQSTETLVLLGGDSCEGSLALSITDDGRVAFGVQMQAPLPLETQTPLQRGRRYTLDAVYNATEKTAEIFIDGGLVITAVKDFALPARGSVSLLSGCHDMDVEVPAAKVSRLQIFDCQQRFCPTTTNLALDQSVVLSSMSRHSGLDGQMCVNGRSAQRGMCSTAAEYEPWLKVDLGRQVHVSSVQVWRAPQCSCRLSSFRLALLDATATATDDAVAEKQFTARCVRGSLSDPCQGETSQKMWEWNLAQETTAQYVTMQLEFATAPLQLAQIKVFGCNQE